VIEDHGAAALSAITAMTAQNTHGVEGVFPVDASVLRAQLRTLLADIRPDVVKIGMLGSSAQVDVVAEVLADAAVETVVLDPVLASTGGVPLLDSAGIDTLLSKLLPLATLITPNWHEAEALTGVRITGDAALADAASTLIERGAQAVLIKGGHRDGEPIDTLFARGEVRKFNGPRIDTPHTHGTGCFLASAIAANLALGVSLNEAVERAKEMLTRALGNPTIIGGGRGYPTPFPVSRHEKAQRINGLYVLTDPVLRPDRSPVEVVRAALAGGARIIQMRDKHRATPELIALARELRGLCRAAGALFFVNDRVDIALACEADGVHLGPDDMSPADARRIAGEGMLIGISVSTVEEAKPIAPYADYLGVGAIYGSSTKSDAGAPVGTNRIREIAAAFPEHPIVAIGGIGASNIADVIDAGAHSVAVISAVICADDMEFASSNLAGAFSAHLK
jgi:hydroxymethylpyrimidine kinase/phosphomethylpyrimidine kinase/thiamine-phosphate diphosphorylase